MQVENEVLARFLHAKVEECLEKVQGAIENLPESPAQCIEGLLKAHEEFEAAGFAMLGGALHGLKEFAKPGATPKDIRNMWALTLARAESQRERMFQATIAQVQRETGLQFKPTHNEQVRDAILREFKR
jgi:hypothetical protein